MVIGILSLTNHQNTGLGRNPDQSTDPNEPQPLQPLQALRCRCNRVTLAVKMLSPMAAPAMAMFNYHGNPLVIQHSHRKLAIFLDDLSIDPNSHGTFGHIYIWVCLEMGYTLRNGPDKYHRESDHTPSIFSVSPSILPNPKKT